MQAFIYSLIRRAGRLDLHDRLGCKFFCFSNLIPPGRRIDAGSKKTLVVSSPDSDIITSLQDEAKRMDGEEIKIGGMAFRLEKSKAVETGIPDGLGEFTLHSGTPIVVRIPRHRLKEVSIDLW